MSIISYNCVSPPPVQVKGWGLGGSPSSPPATPPPTGRAPALTSYCPGGTTLLTEPGLSDSAAVAHNRAVKRTADCCLAPLSLFGLVWGPVYVFCMDQSRDGVVYQDKFGMIFVMFVRYSEFC